MLQRPPGITREVAAGQDDQGVGDSARYPTVINEAPLGMSARPAPAAEAGPIGEDVGGDVGPGASVPHLPSGEWSSSSGGCPGMIPAATPLAQSAMPEGSCTHDVASSGHGGDYLQIVGCSAEGPGKAPQQKKIVFTDTSPADLVVRQAEERKAREEKFAEVGPTAAKIKIARKRKEFFQEGIRDDCGSDLGHSGENLLTNALAIAGSPGLSTDHSYIDGNAFGGGSAGGSEDEFEIVLNDTLPLRYLVGSSNRGSMHVSTTS